MTYEKTTAMQIHPKRHVDIGIRGLPIYRPKQYNINSALPVVKNNASKVYGISNGRLSNVVEAVNQTNGTLYNIRDPFESILDSIANSIINTYSVSLLTHVGPGQHWLHVTPIANDPGGEDKEPFKIGANPVISLSQVTQDMINQGVILGTSSFNIEASVTDPDGGTIQTVNISWADPAAIPTTNAMNTGGANLYNYTYNGTLNVNDCFAFGIQAIDNDGRNTTVPANQGNTPSGQWRICADDPTPVIGTITPDTYDYQQPVSVSTEINDVPSGPASLAVTLKYRETGEILWDNMPMSESGGLFTATIPDLIAGFKGIDVEVVAQDISNNVTAKGHSLTVNTVPVSIIDVTRHTDTLDTGPFAIHAIVAGLDTTSGGQVDLVYTINGGTATTLPMTQTVTGANASLSSQTNLYIERIPTVNLGEKVCYFVQASNPTANTQSQEHCFETLQPAAPLSITPTSAIMAVGDNALEFMAAGGYGTYGWNTLNGTLSTTLADKTLYTPTLAGSDKLSVQDLRGFTATVIINVLPALTLDPAVDGKHFSPASTLQLTASGAESPYQWKIDGATSQVSGNDNESVEITLGAEPATIQVTLTDAKGRTKTATFNNDGQLKIDPAGPEIVVTPDSETAFNALGGDGAYIWTVVGGDVDDPNAANVTYQSPGLPGVYHLTVSDNSGASASVTVKSGQPLRITPHCARIQRDGKAEFKVISGTPPYQWEAKFGMLSATTGEHVSFTPESNQGLYEITVHDSAGAIADLCVQVTDIFVTPANATLSVNETVQLEVTGGNGDYTWAANVGTVSPNTGNLITYTAPGQPNNAIVTVRDSVGNETTASLQIREGCYITPAQAIVSVNDSVQLTTVGCNNPTWTTTSGLLSSSSGNEITYTATGQPGISDTVKVIDEDGRQVSATITIPEACSISPQQATVSVNGTVELTAVGCLKPNWTATLGTTSPFNGNTITYTAPGQPGQTDTITVTDSTGQQASATISIPTGCAITPEVATVAINQTVQLTAVGCKNPTWTTGLGILSQTTGDTITYTASGQPGQTDTVTLNDSDGQQAISTITIPTACSVIPATATVSINESLALSAVGCTNPSWTTSIGTLSATTGQQITYTGTQEAEATVTITDTGSGQQAIATIQVIVPPLTISPSATAVDVSQTRQFTAQGGDGNYNWTVVTGKLSSPTGESVTYTAPSTADIEDIVTVTDKSGHSVVAKIRVERSEGTFTITPAKVNMADGGTQQGFRVHNARGQVHWTASAGSITDTGLYTAPASSGSYKVIATDYTSGRTAEATIIVAAELTLTPSKKVLTTGESTTFTVKGGEPDYTWRVIGEGFIDSETGETVRFTAGTSASQVRLVVADNKGLSSEAEITVTGELLITPENVTLPRGTTQQFKAFGGSGEFTWIATQGNIDETGLYTVPDVLGTYVITAHDSAGKQATVNVTVANVPVITPAKVWLDMNETATLSVVGGVAPFEWTATVGSITENGDTVTYTAPNVSQKEATTITVTDNRGEQSETVVYVDLPLFTSSKKIFRKPGETRSLSVAGGIPPFDWQTGKGEMKKPRTEELGENIYTAPNVMGEDIITIRDRKNNTTTVKVQVTQPIAVTPYKRYMKREETKSFTVVSGIAPFTATVTDGDGDLEPASSEDGHFKFTSGSTADDDVTIEFSDNGGQTTQVHAYIERQLHVSSPTLDVEKGAEIKFKVRGGTGGFFIVAERGFAEVDEETGDGTYEAPNRFGTFKLTVVDSSDQTLEFEASVEPSSPQISPSAVTMFSGETRTFTVNRGVPDYTWAFESNTVQSMDSQNSVVQITAPQTAGKYDVSVTDKAGNETTATITVIQPLIIRPVSYTFYKGDSKPVRFTYLGGAGICDWLPENVQVVERGNHHIMVLPQATEVGTQSSISCRDQNADIARASLIVTNRPGDLDGNGSIDETEAQIGIDKFFRRENLNGVKMDRTQLFLHLESFMGR
ncbi:MAG: hypothetical protein DRR16_21580 [Candidatus Parabeggiatoa sp. nov. 3]|nr:MAG: hypothetical protein DRR00_05235 [Gammaproteobacteria bacterium]RKZ81681.1 MAG: hypothetical protein DRR16_21580 [Gammaproteobacteria bacterium]HEW97308.1 hypothetical protein [Beggiatoa sp.]